MTVSLKVKVRLVGAFAGWYAFIWRGVLCIFSSSIVWGLAIKLDILVCHSQRVILCDPTYTGGGYQGWIRSSSHAVHLFGSFLFACLSVFRSAAVPYLSGSTWASTPLLPAGQPGQQQRSSHQLSGLSQRHICGGQDAPTCGEVRHMQRSHRESKAALWMTILVITPASIRTTHVCC